MREILFRAKREDNGDWVYGDLIHNIDCVKVRERETAINRIAKSYEVFPKTVGQYTGLKDRNGKEIWEGDIVRYPCGAEYETFYDDEMMSFRLKNGTDIHSLEIESNFELEVIGNIHDNASQFSLC